jgi:alpha-amylase/alpha-mannosidase (GH57 family)
MKHLCIHGHFYQPSRENPWTDVVEVEDTASPYHDWNERVTAECYARNASSRLLDEGGRILRIVNNYAHLSYNVGPTLLRWLARHAPGTYELILEGDRVSRKDQYGHGGAIAQVFNHVIMPLATTRDRVTQVRWGIRDFERRFKRKPEGIWLPETAVDVETLEILVSHGMAFTLLAPHQAKRIRRAEGAWKDVTEETLDVTVPYRCRLPSGRSIAIFFYHGPTSRAVAFEGLLHDGKVFADRLTSVIPDDQQARILVVASDGETYGHHHKFGDMALAYAMDRLARDGTLRIINLATFLAAHPPTHEAEIAERTSWSCVHGVERWRSDCGCNTGKGWHQRWRGPLREGITRLAEGLSSLYETRGAQVFRDAWAARDEAVDLLDPTPGVVEAFLSRHGAGTDSRERTRTALRLLEMQRQAMLMQSSDGWFFDDVSGAETVQILSHAARALDLARGFGADLEEEFIGHLRRAPGNLERWPDGGAVYDHLVRRRAVGAREAAAYYVMTGLVGVRSQALVGTIAVTERDRADASSGSHTLGVGRVLVRSAPLDADEDVVYAVAHFGGHEVHCAVADGWDDVRYAEVRTALLDRYRKEVVSEVVRAIDQAFGSTYFTLRDLPLADRRSVLARLSERTLGNLEDVYRRLYHDNRPLMEYLRDAGAPVPVPLVTAAVVALTRDLEDVLAGDAGSPLRPRAQELLTELRSWGREVHPERFEPLLRRRLEHSLASAGPVADRLTRATDVLDFAEAAGVTMNLWEAQNAFYRLTGSARDANLKTLGDRLHFVMDKIE